MKTPASPTKPSPGPASVDGLILEIRGQRVMLAEDLAGLYGVESRALIQAVKRNKGRFPADFMFQLSASEWENLKSQIVISSSGGPGWGGRRHAPYAFTEQGVAMLSSVLRSRKAVEVNVEIMRAFVRLRRYAATNAELARKFGELERRVGSHDVAIGQVLDAIRRLMALPPAAAGKKIGFRPPGGGGTKSKAKPGLAWKGSK